MDDRNGSNLQENIFRAIQTIVDSEIRDVKFDKTIKCTITNADNRKDGEYTVSDGSIEFKAYSDQKTYRKSEQVLVNVGGDMSEEKTILRRYTTEDSQTPVAYVPPLDSMIQLSQNIIDYGTFVTNKTYYSQNGHYFSILANGDNQRPNVKAQNDTERTIWECDLTDNNLPYTIRSNAVYDTLGIKASFKTLLGANTYDVRTGRYGIKISLVYQPSAETSDNPLTAVYVLDSIADMAGNPYEYQIFFEQQKKINISNIGQITHIKISLYQSGQDSFKYYDSHDGQLKNLPFKIPSKTEEDTDIYLPDNIFVSDEITLTFGYDASNYEDNTLLLVSNDIPFYDFIENNQGDDINKKSAYVLWVNKTNDNEYIGFSDGIYSPGYDEAVYQKDYYEKAKGINLQNQELLIAVPPILEALQVYANAQEINQYYADLEGYVSGQISLSASSSFYQLFYSLYTFFDKTLDGKKLLDYIPIEYQSSAGTGSIKLTKEAAELSDAIETALLSTRGTETDSANASQILYNNFLTQYNDIFNSGEIPEIYPTVSNQISINHNVILMIWDKFKLEMGKNFDQLFTLSKSIENGYVTIQNAKYNYDIIVNKVQQIIDILESLVPDTQDCCDKLKQRFIDGNLVTVDEDYAQLVSQNERRYDLRWYRYNPAASDSLAGPGWEYITKENCPAYQGSGVPNRPGIDNMLPVYCDESVNGIKELDMEPYEDKESLILKAILYYNHEAYESNELEFVNANPVVDTTTAGAANGLQITHGEGSSASYQLYGVTNMLLNAAEAQTRREIRVDYLDPATKQINNNILLNGEIHWFVPSQNTMLSFDDRYLQTYHGYSAAVQSSIKPGYWDFQKFITSDDDLKFYYNISSLYVPTAINNTIICEITSHKIRYSGSQEFVFSTYGNSGTDYTLSIRPENLKTAFIEYPLAQGTDTTEKVALNLNVGLYDFDGKKIAKNIQLKIIPSYRDQIFRVIPTETTLSDDDTVHRVTVDSIFGRNRVGILPDLNNHFYGLYNVLEITAPNIEQNDKRSIDLVSYYPIPYASGEYYLEGPSTIIYDSQGQNPSYYKAPYKLYDSITNEAILHTNYILIYFDTKSTLPTGLTYDEVSEKERSYLPVLNNQNSLVPLNIFVEDTGYNTVLVAYQGELGEDNYKFLFAQPLLIMQNRYPAGMINSWDGSLTIDEENGTILSTMVGAGRKNDNDNTFSGVLMGDIESNDGSTSLGLYGFHHGAQSFGFKEDGTGFIGKAGSGRIILNGDTGEIKSATWDNMLEGKPGMRIDLDDGIIRMRGPIRTGNVQAEITISAGEESGQEISYLEIKDDGARATRRNFTIGDGSNYAASDIVDGEITSQTLIKIARSAFYLQSHNFKDVNTLSTSSVPSGFQIDLLNGIMKATNFTLLGFGNYRPSAVFQDSQVDNGLSTDASSQETLGSLIITTDNTAFPISLGAGLSKTPFTARTANFAIGWDGTVIAKKGKIGGWSLLEDRLQSNDGRVGIASRSIGTTVTQLGSSNDSIQYDTTSGNFPIFWADTTIRPYGTNSTGELANNWQNMNFYVTMGGFLHATRGEIGSWTITKRSLYSKTGNVGDEIFSILTTPSSSQNSEKVALMFGARPNLLSFNTGEVDVNTTDETVLQASSKFYIKQNGRFYAQEGKIGSWTINSTRLFGVGQSAETDFKPRYAILNTPIVTTNRDNQWILGIGCTTEVGAGSAPFRVDLAGNLHTVGMHATEAEISGSISADKGSIGGWSITKDENGRSILKAGNTTLSSNGTITTGSLYASYGKIGNWNISGTGLSGGTISSGSISTNNLTVTNGSITWGSSRFESQKIFWNYAFFGGQGTGNVKVLTNGSNNNGSKCSFDGTTGKTSTWRHNVYDTNGSVIGYTYMPSHSHSFSGSITTPAYETKTFSVIHKEATYVGLAPIGSE